MANDFHYGIGACGADPQLPGLRIEALPANAGVVTCLANDTGYENIFSHQLEVKANEGDILIVLSGSGNSNNIVKALETAKMLKVRSFAIIAFDGGKCLHLADHSIFFPSVICKLLKIHNSLWDIYACNGLIVINLVNYKF